VNFFPLLRGRPPNSPFDRDAFCFAGDVLCPPNRAILESGIGDMILSRSHMTNELTFRAVSKTEFTLTTSEKLAGKDLPA
jgi:hypothetical protein